MSITLIGLIVIALYLFGGTCQVLRLKSRPLITQRQNLQIVCVAAALHAYTLYLQLYSEYGISLNLFTVASLTAWLVVCLNLIACRRLPLHNLQIFLLPVAALIQASTLLFSGPEGVVQMEPTRVGHILASITAYSFFTLAACQALLLAYQDHQLKQHQNLGLLQIFPPLQTMEKLLFALIWVGLLLLSFSLISGFIILDDLFAQHLVHRTLLSVFAWCLFASLLLGHHLLGWRGQLAIRATLAGFLLLMLAYFGSKFVLDLVLTAG